MMLSKAKELLLKNNFETLYVYSELENNKIAVLAFYKKEVFILAPFEYLEKKNAYYYIVNNIGSNCSDCLFYKNKEEILRFINNILR